jgi:hypothetical protein
MAYAPVQDIAAGWERCERVAAGLSEPPPAGLVVHVADLTDEPFPVIAIWESETAWAALRAEHRQTAIAAFAGRSRPEATFRDLLAAHVVLRSVKPVATT